MTIRSLVAAIRCYGFLDIFQSFYYWLRFQYTKHIARRPFFLRPIYDYAMYLDCNDPGISKALAVFGKRELEHCFMLERELKPGMVVWDCGANIGYYAIMEAKIVGPSGKVYAVEPSPMNVALLKKNIELNHLGDTIDVSPLGISNRNGEAEFYLSAMSNVNTFHPTTRSGGRAAHLTGRTIRVPTMDVPTFIQGKRPVDLVRMDIEGHEVEVFESIIRAIDEQGFSARILFETHFPKYDDREHNMREKLEGLFARGYVPKIIASTDENKAKFREHGYTPAYLVKTDGVTRGMYYNVHPEDAVKFICDLGGVRTVLLEHLTPDT